ncbi:AMP-binding protein [Agrobacterium rhizogenes]|uniref:3-methylmercaptopropionyl-CoA ligase n=1 Tax=Rhizobium rhizogenes NBRC 13257 TaxID=1220581 RepID=A0AA87QGC5_RHIRH|nr:AMP-binding protein [Rhizobium rhizogenes]NTG64815.1 AMP-binding protein [Rhizobium rhizogenes]NTG71585.1 AMP-binding protein [Rhizobium rhizogenes]NTG84165.1 AMP-binding protein [Rhizobium rhizogenes]NTG90892.1 AMP-binding protein [Rhizobium rhizogenes]NTH29501.1 AMP-binding protein [Rhizobium rhizogenes]
MFNLSRFLAQNARVAPKAEALVYEGVRLDWESLEARVGHLAWCLRQRGLSEGSIVALLMKNSLAYVELIYAIGHIGAVVLPMNFRLSADEVRYITLHAGAQLIFADDIFVDATEGTKLPVILLDEAGRSNVAAMLDVSAKQSHIAADIVPRGRDSIFRLMYTSGTTSRPKGVVHTYDSYYWKCYDHILTLGLNKNTRLLIVGPMYHVGGCDLPGLAVHLAGGTIVIQRDFEPRKLLETIAHERIDGIWLAPVMTSDILALPDENLPNRSSLRWCIAGGERTPESRIRAFLSRFPEARYIDAYGMTETCSGDTMMDPGRELEKIGSVGRPLRFVEIEIRDECGKPMSAGEEGEICIRGPKVMREYWRDPDNTAAAFYSDGYMHSGDVGYMDRDGFLFITDRQKDMIISGGENIASSEVERVIYGHSSVKEAAIFARPHPRWGEIAVAAIVLVEARSLSFDELLKHCEKSLAKFKCPKDLVVLSELPRNPSGKVLKRVLRDMDQQGQFGAAPSIDP